jgi:hypothetical protein
VDGLVGFRANAPLNDHWKWYFRGDVGAGGSDFAWNVETAFAWRPNDRFSMVMGWRALDISIEEGSGANEFEFDGLLSGPILGFALHF